MSNDVIVVMAVAGLIPYMMLPHRWRSVLIAAVFVPYLAGLVWLLRQDPMDARMALKEYVDDSLGVEVPEKQYGDDCMTWQALVSVMDLFVIAHTVGWMASTMVVRSWRMAFLMSLVDEVVEYSFACHHPNFAECWWDHLFDVGCNFAGVLVGAWLCRAMGRPLVSWFTGATRSLDVRMTIVGMVTARVFLFLCIFGVRCVLWIPDSHAFNVLHPLLHLLVVERVVEEHFAPPSKGGSRLRVWLMLAWCGWGAGMALITKHGYLGACLFEILAVRVGLVVTLVAAVVSLVYLVGARLFGLEVTAAQVEAVPLGACDKPGPTTTGLAAAVTGEPHNGRAHAHTGANGTVATVANGHANGGSSCNGVASAAKPSGDKAGAEPGLAATSTTPRRSTRRRAAQARRTSR